MVTKSKLVAFAATTNGAAARSFYETTLGLPVISDDTFALVLDANGTPLRVQKVQEFSPQPFTTLGWEVSEIRAAVEELGQRGVTFQKYAGMDQDALGIWSSPSGALVAWFKDPDGNTLSLTEHRRS